MILEQYVKISFDLKYPKTNRKSFKTEEYLDY